MFSTGHPLIENILFVIVLAFMGWYDYKKLSLEPVSLILLAALTFTLNFWQALALFAIGYGIMFMSAVIGDVICQRDSIAGGDMIIAGVCCAYMGLKWFVMAFVISAVIGQMAIWIYYRYHRHLNIPYVPYLAAGVLGALCLPK
jgi:prepilin signal peptidase PulO-like enzyme (type II secretory pathway)